jgi:opacity protein-like surface antigen
MRKLTLTAGVAALAIGAVGAAQAVTPTTALKTSVSPTKHGTKKKPRNVKLNIELITQPNPNDGPFATKTTVVHFDKNLKFGGKYVKTCSADKVRSNNTACPRGSKVGTGSATGVALGLTENLTVTAYNGPGGNKIELLVSGTSPLTIHDVIEGKLQSDKGKFGKKLVVAIPDTLQQPAPGAFATLTDFKTSVKGTGSKKRPFVGLAGCTKKKLNFQADFVFTDGSTSTAKSTAKCS